MTTKKYILTEETKEVRGVTLHRIKALRDFGDINAGTLGGWIERGENLSHEGNAFVCDDAKVWGNAKVCGDAEVCDDAKVWGNAIVWGDAEVCGNAKVCGDAKVWGNAKVWGDAEVCDDAKVWGNAFVCDDAKVCGDAKVWGNAKVCGDAEVCDDAKVWGNAKVWGDAEVCGNAKVCGDAEVCGDAKVCGDADYIVFKNWWSFGRYFTWTRSNNLWKVGCFHGTGEDLIKKAYADSEKSGREYERVVRYVGNILAGENNESKTKK